jgi:hypothetical protein
MPEPVLLSDCKIWLGGYDISRECNRVELKAAKAELADGRFGDTAEPFAHGLQQIDATVAGLWAATEVDGAVWPRIDPTLSPLAWPLTIAPPVAPGTAAGADGNLAYSFQSGQFYYTVEGQHGEIMPFEIRNRVRSGGLYRQTIVSPKATVASSTTGNGRQLGVVGATQKLVAVLHVFAITGGSWVLTIESDDNAPFLSATVRATFTAVTTAPNRQVVEVTGPFTDTYWRAIMTKTGGTDLTYAVALSVENV